MKFPTGKNTQHYVESLDYGKLPSPTPSGFNTEPRCSLDFYIELDDGTILGDKIFRIQNFSGKEQLSQLFEFHVTLHANTFTSSGQDQPWAALTGGAYGTLLSGTNSEQISFQKILGAKACIRLGLPETDLDTQSSYPDDRGVVFYNGIITSFAMAQRGVYQATIKPALFKLSLQNRYRLFSQQTILDVVMEVLSENNIEFNRAELEAAPNKIIRGLANYRTQDWLQAGETDLEFMQRLMEKVSLFFYFIHSDDKHTMVVTDQPYYQSIYLREVVNGKTVESESLKPMYLSFSKQQTADRDDYITQFQYQQNLTSSGISTVLAQKEANWESQNTAQTSPVYIDYVNATEKLNMELLHVVQYGATETEISALTDTNMNKLTASRFSFSGSATCPEFRPGYQFLLNQRDGDGSAGNDAPFYPSINNDIFVLTSVDHHATVEGEYSNQFTAADANGLAMPFSSQTGNTGSILAQVIDNSAAMAAQAQQSDTIETLHHEGSPDKYLRKDVFSFDSNQFYYNFSEDSFKCKGIFVRFIDQPDSTSPQWVKLAEHMQTIPEINTYVVISRSTDNNEIPEVTQSLQAKGSKVIMPDDYTTHTNVGNSYGTNYGDSTNIGFGWDVTRPLSFAKNIVETQRETGNYNGVSYNESSSYGYSVTPRSHNIARTGSGPDLTFNPSDMMSFVSYGHQATYGDTYNKSEHTGASKAYNTQTGHSYSKSTQTGGSTSESDIDWTDSTSTIGSSTSYTEIGSTSSTNLTGTASSTSLTGQQTSISVTGVSANVATTGMASSANLTGMSMSSSMTGMSISSNMVGLTSDVSMVGISSHDSVTGTSVSSSVTGASVNTSILGASTGTSITGASISTGITGASSGTNITGVSDSTNITGSSTSTNITGSHTGTNITGSSTDISITGSSTSISITASGSFIRLDNTMNVLTKELEAELISTIKTVL